MQLLVCRPGKSSISYLVVNDFLRRNSFQKQNTNAMFEIVDDLFASTDGERVVFNLMF